MRAVQITATGGPEQLRVSDVVTPTPGRGQVLVRVSAAGVNFIDVYHRNGAYPMTLPAVPGVEGAGTVEAVGEAVNAVVPGDRVAFAMTPGTYAESVVVPADRLVPVPDGLEAITAAAVLLQGMTAHFLATSTVPLAHGHRILVHAAAGGVGLLLTQIAKRRGATVYATVSSAQKAELARAAGADEVIIYARERFVDAVADFTDDAGVDVVYDGVGKDTSTTGSSACGDVDTWCCSVRRVGQWRRSTRSGSTPAARCISRGRLSAITSRTALSCCSGPVMCSAGRATANWTSASVKRILWSRRPWRTSVWRHARRLARCCSSRNQDQGGT